VKRKTVTAPKRRPKKYKGLLDRKELFQNLLDFYTGTQLCIPDYMESGRAMSDFSKPCDTPLPAPQERHPQLVPTGEYFASSNRENAKLVDEIPNSGGRRSRKSYTPSHSILTSPFITPFFLEDAAEVGTATESVRSGTTKRAVRNVVIARCNNAAATEVVCSCPHLLFHGEH
jgi:hypothetical protein